MHRTDIIIDDIVNATCIGKDGRAHHLMRESLRSLVRLAKAEQLTEIRKSGTRLARQATRATAKA